MYEQIVVLIIVVLTLVLFIEGSLRYDFVAIIALLLLVLLQIIKIEDAFLGFSHPAVITILSVLVIGQALVKTGVVDKLVNLLDKGPKTIKFKIFSLMLITAILSAFMNNIGALALILPIALKIAKDNELSPSKFLMPIAFASLLGGTMTSIGTPPNIIISSYREDMGLKSYSFFAFFPIGITITIIGIVFTSLIGYKLIPLRKSKNLNQRFNLEDYLFEIIVTNNFNENGIKLKDIYQTYNINMNIVNIIRNKRQIISPGANTPIISNDILIVKALPESLNEIISKTGFELKGADKDKLVSEGLLKSSDISLVEVVLREDSPLIGRTAIEVKLRNRYNANLIAVSRKGVSKVDRLKNFKFLSGDILLLQVPNQSLEDLYVKMRALPLSDNLTDITKKVSTSTQIFTLLIFVVAIIISAFNILPVQITFLIVAVIFVISKILTPREFYEAIEWPSIIMIGSLFSLGLAIESSGASNTIAQLISSFGSKYHLAFTITLIMILTIILTNLINNTASTILMAPLAISVATILNVSVDPLLMAVVIGASTSFLTPIGHQSNMLVMGPGGYEFKDYYKLGLPLTILTVIVSVPLIILIWF